MKRIFNNFDYAGYEPVWVVDSRLDIEIVKYSDTDDRYYLIFWGALHSADRELSIDEVAFLTLGGSIEALEDEEVENEES